MATEQQITRLRLILGPGVLTDAELSDLIDLCVPEGESDPNMLEAQALAWETAAGRYHALVDTSESGSSRSMSQMFKNATAMAAALRAQITARDEVTVEIGRTRSTTRRITRI